VFSWILVFFTVGEFINGRRELDKMPPREEIDASKNHIGLKQNGRSPNGTNGNNNGIAMTRSSGIPIVVSSGRFQKSRQSPHHHHSHHYPSSSYHPNGRPFSRDYDSWNGSITSDATSPAGSTLNGSTASTVSTTVSTLPRGVPLRSSLKKSRTTTGDSSTSSIMGIPNPGFSGSSPTLSRTSSVKKVRIQTFTTDV
jgi:hypothetical protein